MVEEIYNVSNEKMDIGFMIMKAINEIKEKTNRKFGALDSSIQRILGSLSKLPFLAQMKTQVIFKIIKNLNPPFMQSIFSLKGIDMVKSWPEPGQKYNLLYLVVLTHPVSLCS